MSPRLARILRPAAALAAAVLLSACSFSLGGLPASDRDRDSQSEVRDQEGNLLTGLFTRTPRDLPDAVPVPAREATVERGYGGVILRVTGVGPTQGYYNATLAPQNDGTPDAAGLVTVDLVAVPPDAPEAVGPERTRLLMAAAFMSDLELREVSGFRLVTAQGAQTLRLPPVPPQPQPDPADFEPAF